MSVVSPYFVEDRRRKIISAACSIGIHLLLLLLAMLITTWNPKQERLIELDWGGIGGGSGNNPMFAPEKEPDAATPKPEAEKVKIETPKMTSSSEVSLPVPKKKVKETSTVTTDRVLTSKSKSRKRSGSGGGSGGGIGKSTGYSIDWGGATSRKLLSGEIPVYPEGTNKELPVLMQFSVLPDGSVMNVIPVKKSDELLEREAMRALKTWRFDPLPVQYDQKTQVGKVTFVFKLEH
ncbi:MAG: TonB family protein [Bacteroidetes bacterium]|nr:MAG: TonB family protein [Bacteroidota bacterium]